MAKRNNAGFEKEHSRIHENNKKVRKGTRMNVGIPQHEIDAFFDRHPEAKSPEEKFSCLLKAVMFAPSPQKIAKERKASGKGFKWKNSD